MTARTPKDGSSTPTVVGGSGSAKVNLTLGFPQATPRYFSPNGDGVRDTSLLGFRLTRAASVKVVVKNAAGVVRSFSLGSLQPGAAGATWDGQGETDKAPGGAYTFTVTATNSLGTIAVSGPVNIDRYVPRPTVPADFSIAYGSRIAYVYSVRDPYTKSVYVRVEVRNGRGVLLANLVPYRPVDNEAYDRATVDRFWKAALVAGGRDNGAPGLRPHYHPNYYGAFVLDPDGNNIEAVCHRPLPEGS